MIKEHLEDAKKRQVEIVNRINALANERQALLQEALKIEGEIRVLMKLEKEGYAGAKVAELEKKVVKK